MTKSRLEAFSDGVMAIIITIMVLGLEAPESATLDSLRPLVQSFISYVLSFIYIGIYWHNHHHLLQAATKVNGRVLWANTHWLFWLSLVPFVTSWADNTEFAAKPMAAYGVVLLMAAVSYAILTRTLINAHGYDSHLARAMGRDVKSKASMAIHATAIAMSFYWPLAAGALYAGVAVMWLIPDRRIERVLARHAI